MPAKKDTITNPFFSDYVYDCIVNSTEEQRRLLNMKYRRATRYSKSARNFSLKSTHEEKILMLSKLGIPCFFGFNMDEKKLRELYGKTEKLTNVEITDFMLNEKVFLITDKQFMLFAGLMASNCHSETWLLNRDFLKASYKVKQFRKDSNLHTINEGKESLSATKELARMMGNTIMLSKYSNDHFRVNDAEVAVMMYIYSRSKEFIPIQDLRNQFNGIYSNFKLVKSLKELLLLKYIEKGEGNWDNQYRITGWGIDIILKFEKKVFELENY